MAYEKLRHIIAKIMNVDVYEISMETKFDDDLAADSLDMYQILTVVESEFEITVAEELIQDQQLTVGSMLNYIEGSI